MSNSPSQIPADFSTEALRGLPPSALESILSLPLGVFTKRRIAALLETDPEVREKEIRTIDEEESAHRIAFREETLFSELIRPKTTCPLIAPDFIREYRREFIVTSKAIGAYELAKGEIPSKKSDENYRFWMAAKLNLPKEETEKLPLETVERRFSEKLDQARKHVSDRIALLPPEIADRFKSSQYFDDIHALGDNAFTPRQLFSFFVGFERARETYAHKGTHPNAVRELRKTQYEIQRLFALADLYRDYEQTPEYQNLDMDSEFLTNKVSSLFERPAEPDTMLPPIRSIRPKNLLYSHTKSLKRYWKKRKDGTYDISEHPFPRYSELELESATFVGKRREALKRRTKIDALHVEIRSMKDAASAVDKYLRKGMTSFGEIIDQKGMIIVIDSFDGHKAGFLRSLLENELGTGSTTWKEPLEWVSGDNPHTKSGYRCLKGVMKVPHKLKPMKASIKSIADTIESLVAKGRKTGRNKKDVLADVRSLETQISGFSDRFRDSSYNVTLEVQIFDLESYIGAGKDPESAANHDRYKRSQIVREILPILFPVEIYGESAFRAALMPEIREMLSEEGS